MKTIHSIATYRHYNATMQNSNAYCNAFDTAANIASWNKIAFINSKSEIQEPRFVGTDLDLLQVGGT